MGKIGVFLCLTVGAVLAAGLFGALHNQLSYSVGPSYFHDLKFEQFAVNEARHNRLGAALVGWRAAWWMGLVVGLPALLLGLFLIAKPQTYLAAGIGAIGAVIFVTMTASLIGLASGIFWVDPARIDAATLPDGIGDPEGFVRAALMHQFSYYGGIAGALVALWTVWRVRNAGGGLGAA